MFIFMPLFLHLFLQQQKAHEAINFSKTEPIPGYTFSHKVLPLRLAMISVLNHADTAQYQDDLAEALSRELKRPVLVLRRKSYLEIEQLLVRNEADVALLSTGAYCVYGKANGFRLLAMQERNHLAYYYGYIVTLKNSGIDNFSQLKGKSFAFVDPLSYSGYLGVQEMLQSQGSDAAHYFKSFYFTYSHDASLRAVLNGFVAGAAVDSLAYDYLKKHHPQKAQRLRIIYTLPPRGTSPVVARHGLKDWQKIQSAFLNLQNDPQAKEAMQHLLIDRFIRPQPQLYPPIELSGQKGN